MALNLDDNKRPYFKQLNLDETFDEIQNAVNVLEASLPSYQVIRGLISQSGTSEPTITILENTTGLTLTPMYDDVGSYFIMFSSQIIPATRIYYSITQYQISINIGMDVRTTGIELYTAYPDGTGGSFPVDNVLYDTPFELIIYPS